MKKPSKNTKKCFLIASFMGSVMKAHQPDIRELQILHRQIDRAMKVYSVTAGKQEYHDLTSEGFKIWKVLSEEYSTRLESDEVEIFVDLMGTLIPPKNYEEYLAVPPFISIKNLEPETMLRVCKSLLALNGLVNELLGTSSYRVPLPTVKKVKVKRVRDKSKRVKKDEVVSKSKLKEAERKGNVRSFLRDRIAKANTPPKR